MLTNTNQIERDISQEISVRQLATLDFARGKVGDRFPLSSSEDILTHAEMLRSRITEITKVNTAFCGDERVKVSFADGTTDPEVIEAMITPKLFGGIWLASTKACYAADASIIRDSTSFSDAAVIIGDILPKLGYELAGHVDCGANKNVKSSVENPIDEAWQFPAVRLFISPDEEDDAALHYLLSKNRQTKTSRVNAGQYDSWDPNWFETQLYDRAPQNFALMKSDPEDHELHGHNGSSLLILTQPGHGFRKNGQAFSLTTPFMRELATKLGATDEERARIQVGFVEDSLEVAAGIVIPGFPVFGEIVE